MSAQAFEKAGSLMVVSISMTGMVEFRFSFREVKSAWSASGSWKGWPSALMMLMAFSGMMTVTGAG